MQGMPPRLLYLLAAQRVQVEWIAWRFPEHPLQLLPSWGESEYQLTQEKPS